MKLYRRTLIREWKTVQAMLGIFCRAHHKPFYGQLCLNCEGLLFYIDERLEKCPFKENKPACAECAIHCYQTEKRKLIIDVMRYAGPRMIWHHPLLALRHLLCGLKFRPGKPQRDGER